MTENATETVSPQADPAAIFAAAISLWQACHEREKTDPSLQLSEVFNGVDNLMRESMRIASLFEQWACEHIKFQDLEEVWPYRLEDGFGKACLGLFNPFALDSFDSCDCLRVALAMDLPIKLQSGLPVPFDLVISNSIPGSSFPQFRIQTVRNHIEDGISHPFCHGDEPYDENFTEPYFSFYGVGSDGTLEHIADRTTYTEVATLIRKLLPHIVVQGIPTTA